ncbi:hypothetical protein GCM10028895_45580 [Pontibacter rugosus]
MFNQAIVRVGIRYGVLCGLVSFALVAILYFIGYNPFGDIGRLTYVPIPVFIFLAIRYFKQYNDTELSLGKGLRVGLSVAFYNALSAAMLVFLFIYMVGSEILLAHVAEMKALLEETREEQIEIIGEESFSNVYNALDSLTPSMQAADFFFGG